MKKIRRRYFWTMLITMAVTFSLSVAGTKAAEKVQQGGTLTFTDYFPGLNPLSWDNADWVWKHGYDTGYYMEHLLVGDLQKGPRGSNKFSFQSVDNIPYDCLRGELAEKWEAKKNPPRIVFHLRRGVMWQEKPGVMTAREFIADDVVYSLNRAKSSRKMVKTYDIVDRFEVNGKYTVTAHLKQWNPEWPYYLGYGYYDAIQAPEQEKAPGGATKWQNACGTGPFMLEEYKNGHSQVYKKNPNYWDTEVINGQKYKLPLLGKVVLMLMRDESTRLTALRTGKLDMMLMLDWRQMQELKKTTPELVWNKYGPFRTIYIALRMDRKPFNDVRVRRALNMAIDKAALLKAFDGGHGELLNAFYPPYNKSVHTPLDKLPPTAKDLFIYNPDKAKKLLVEAGYPNGFSFKCTLAGEEAWRTDYMAMIAAMLAKVGVTMEIELTDYPTGMSRMTKKTHENAYFIPNPHAAPLVQIRKLFLTGQPWNASMMSDPYVDKTWNMLYSNPKLTQQQLDAEFKKLGVYIIEQAPMLFLPGTYRYVARWPWVKNYYGETRVGAHRVAPVMARIWIDEELKKKMGY